MNSRRVAGYWRLCSFNVVPANYNRWQNALTTEKFVVKKDRVFQKELYSGIPNVAVWLVLRER
jgi:hypothetical protein